MKLPERLDRRFEGVVLIGDDALASAGAADDVSALLTRGVSVAFITSRPLAAVTERFGRSAPEGGVLVCAARGGAEVGLLGASEVAHPPWHGYGDVAFHDGPTDVAAGRRVLAELWSRGVGPRDVLVVVEERFDREGQLARLFAVEAASATVAWVGADRSWLPSEIVRIGDGAAAALELLRDQIRRRDEREVPEASDEPGWTFSIEGFDVDRERVHETLLALTDGEVGISGAPLTAQARTHPWVLCAGAYGGEGPETHLLTGPIPVELPCDLEEVSGLRRTLDIRAGLLHEVVRAPGGLIPSTRFLDLTRPGTFVLRARCPRSASPPQRLLPPADDPLLDEGAAGDTFWMRVGGSPGGILAAATDRRLPQGDDEVIDRFAAYRAGSEAVPEVSAAAAPLRDAAETGFDRLLVEHRRAWASRWEDADVVIEGDDELQRAVRFALFHLMASAGEKGESALGARGLTGTSYRGHVFWDTDTFVLPFLAATHPESARAVLEYRVRRLPEAMEAARALGRSGARFPWESAGTGKDVTPLSARDRTGRVVPIRTGQLEEHIVAQVAWAGCCYVDWTGDQAFARGPGLRLLVETARYWASRIRVEPDGTAHLYGVIGPDEYHEPVDDNAFTNVMAGWNLRRAAAAVQEAGGDGTPPEEPARWLELAGALVDGYDSDSGIYEQFAGFMRLEPLIIEEVAPRRPIAADLLLGADRVRQAQVLKQADVLMLHHQVPDEVAPGSLEPNLRFYEPRTAHGSSLSPAVHASLFARARDFGRALPALRIAAQMDLDDLTGSSAGGLHLATMGGLWQALAFGFAGLRPAFDGLVIDPRLPPTWSRLDIRVRFRGSRVRISKERGHLSIRAAPPAPVVIDGSPYAATPDGIEFERRRGPTWEVVP